jgi:hypothetical protein
MKEKICNCGLKESEHNVRHPFVDSERILTKEYMYSLKNYQCLMNGVIFRRQASEFLNIRVDFCFRDNVYLQLETTGSGFVNTLKVNTVNDLHELEKMFGL